MSDTRKVLVTNRRYPGVHIMVPVQELKRGTAHLLSLLKIEVERREATVAQQATRARAGRI